MAAHPPAFLKLCGVPVVVFCALLISLSTHAHAPEWAVENPSEAATLRFVYSDGTPMAFSKIRITDPVGSLFQMGNTDRDGRFSFTVQDFGFGDVWQVVATGDEGHTITAQVSKETIASLSQLRGSVSSWTVWLLIASAVTNLILLTALLQRRSHTSPQTNGISLGASQVSFTKPDTG